MSDHIDIKDLEASPIYRYGLVVRKWCVRSAMAATVAFIFMSPAVTEPKQALAACPANTTSCDPDAGIALTCTWDPGANDFCMPDGAGNGQGNAPEMPALLVPLFIAAASGMAYRIRRKALARA